MSGSTSTILLVDDEAVLRQVLSARLTARGYSVHEASTGEDALEMVPVLKPGVIVLDIGLPDIDGIEVTRRLRLLVQIPIIILSVHKAESDKIAALDAGADDYLAKPCDLGVLLDRIRTALSRATIQSAAGIFATGDLVVDLSRQTVEVANRPVQLTATEYRLLKALVFGAGRLLTQRRLTEEVWGGENKDERSVQLLKASIGTLREKLDANSSQDSHIATEPGVGYRLRIVPST